MQSLTGAYRAMNSIERNLAEHQLTVDLVMRQCIPQISAVSKLMISTLKQGGAVFWCGNGGSAADSQHLAAELIGRFKGDRPPLRSVALSTDSSVLTCISNDYSFDAIFARQIQALGRPGDLLVGISTSGKSENVLSALRAANMLGLQTVGLLGNEGGEAKGVVDQAIIIPSVSTARIQEAHILIGHCLCDLIEEGLGFA